MTEFQEYPKYLPKHGCTVENAEQEAAVEAGSATIEVVHSAQGDTLTVVDPPASPEPTDEAEEKPPKKGGRK